MYRILLLFSNKIVANRMSLIEALERIKKKFITGMKNYCSE